MIMSLKKYYQCQFSPKLIDKVNAIPIKSYQSGFFGGGGGGSGYINIFYYMLIISQ